MQPSSSSSTETNGVTGASGVMQQHQMFRSILAAGTESFHCQAYLRSKEVSETKALAAELCRHFYTLGWVSGTGGSISIKVHNDSVPKTQQLLVMSPSGVQKERMVPDDMYVLSSDGFILSTPPHHHKQYPHQRHKCTDCAPIFMKVYEMRGAGAVIHSHGMEACLATMIVPSSKEFRITHMEMIKGVQGHGYHDELVLPIIENTAFEGELTQDLSEAIREYPRATAVLVRNHGVYIWGDSWISAKTQAECYHYLFEAAIKLHQLGLDWSTPSHGPIHVNRAWGCGMNFSRGSKTGSFSLDYMIEPSQRCILLNMEGTMTPRSFISNMLLNEGKNLAAIHDTVDTSQDNTLRTGFVREELVGFVFDDVPEALERWQASGIKVYIYSSGSREGQRVQFANYNFGDLRKYFCGFVDTSVVGDKTETHSYNDILRTVGVDRPSDMLFVTDVFEEAVAARSSGLEVIISVRPGNEPLPGKHGFRIVRSLLEIQF